VTFRQGEARPARYWTLDSIAPVRFPRDEDYVEAAREVLDRAVASRLPDTGLVTTTLSGGFDSAAVTATAARLLGDRRLTAFTRIAGVPHPYTRFDEQGLAGQVAAMHPNIDWVLVDEVHQPSRDFEPEWESATIGVPTNAFARSWFEPIHQRAAAMGARAMLVGTYGNATLSWGGTGLYHEQLRAGRLWSAARTVIQTARHEGKPVFAELRARLAASLEPRALRRRRVDRANGGTPMWQAPALAPDFLRALDYRGDTLGHDQTYGIAVPSRELRWFMLHGEGRTDQAAYFRWHRPYEVLDPFVDRRLVEFALGVPESQYLQRGVKRSLARRAFADRLPAELLAQNGRGKQVPEWYHLASLRREHTAAAIERLAASPLASRVIDVPRLRRLLDTWPKDAETARKHEKLYRNALHQSVVIGAFLRWYEGGNG
jgi:asparagine synthase (glutamine-hydrolysing)